MEFSVTEENYTMTAIVSVIGQDLLISIIGGNSPHIGTVTTFGKETTSETMRFPSHDGRFHKDDILSDEIANEINDVLPGNCVITSGVHVDGITKKQIAVSSQMASKLGQEILNWLKKSDITASFSKPRYYSNVEQPK